MSNIEKVFISADIEGVAGIAAWNEATPEHPDYRYFQQQMTNEVKAACEGAIQAGAKRITVRDAHNKARNLIPKDFPENVDIIRGWSGHPFHMMDGLDESYDAALMIGYHSKAGSSGNPLAHTHSGKILEIRVNEKPVSEFVLNSFSAAYYNVPVVFVSGDANLCKDVKAWNEKITTVSTLEGMGHATKSIHPIAAANEIRLESEKALLKTKEVEPLGLPSNFQIEIEYKVAKDAYYYGFYPGAKLKNDRTLQFETKDHFEVMRLLRFAV